MQNNDGMSNFIYHNNHLFYAIDIDAAISHIYYYY